MSSSDLRRIVKGMADEPLFSTCVPALPWQLPGELTAWSLATAGCADRYTRRSAKARGGQGGESACWAEAFERGQAVVYHVDGAAAHHRCGGGRVKEGRRLQGLHRVVGARSAPATVQLQHALPHAPQGKS